MKKRTTVATSIVATSIIVVLLLVSGCGESAPTQQPLNGSRLKVVMPQGDAGRNGLFQSKPLHKLSDVNGGLKWKAKPDKSVATNVTPISVNGLVYTIYSYGDMSSGTLDALANLRDHLAAMDANTGGTRWDFTGEGTTSRSPVYAYGIVYFSTTDQFSASRPSSILYAVDATNGKEIWRYSRQDAKFGPMVIADKTLYFPSDETFPKLRFHALDLQTGKDKWTFEIEGMQSGAAPIVFNGTVYLSTQWLGLPDNTRLEASTYALDASSGQQKWSRLSPDAAASGEGPFTSSQLNLETIANLHSISQANGVAYALGEQSLHAFDLKTNREMWKLGLNKGTPTSITIAGDTLYFGSAQGEAYSMLSPEEIVIHAVNASTGQEVWNYKVPTTGHRISDLTIDDGVLYFDAGDDAYTYALSGN